jgi:hypothetical protein
LSLAATTSVGEDDFTPCPDVTTSGAGLVIGLVAVTNDALGGADFYWTDSNDPQTPRNGLLSFGEDQDDHGGGGPFLAGGYLNVDGAETTAVIIVPWWDDYPFTTGPVNFGAMSLFLAGDTTICR